MVKIDGSHGLGHVHRSIDNFLRVLKGVGGGVLELGSMEGPSVNFLAGQDKANRQQSATACLV